MWGLVFVLGRDDLGFVGGGVRSVLLSFELWPLLGMKESFCVDVPLLFSLGLGDVLSLDCQIFVLKECFRLIGS